MEGMALAKTIFGGEPTKARGGPGARVIVHGVCGRTVSLPACLPLTASPSQPPPHPPQPDYQFVASAVFCQPPLASCGFSEEEAVSKLAGPVDVFTSK